MKFSIFSILLILLFEFSAFSQVSNKPISRQNLESYLGKSIDLQSINDFCIPPQPAWSPTNPLQDGLLPGNSTVTLANHLCYGDPEKQGGNYWLRFQDMLRMIDNIRPKMVSTAITQWFVNWWDWNTHMTRCSVSVASIKAIDNDIVIQGAPNEFIHRDMVANWNIPQYVLTEFNVSNHGLHFNVYDMAYTDYMTNSSHNYFDYGFHGNPAEPNAIVPDITRLESQMWYFYMATQFIDFGCESISFSNIKATSQSAGANLAWQNVIQRIRNYADNRSDIRFLLVTAQVDASMTNMIKVGNDLLLDFDTAPLRPLEDLTNLNTSWGGGAIVTESNCSQLFNNTFGGKNPSGWECVHNPGQVFLDNFGSSFNGIGTVSSLCWLPYHFDDISWYGVQDETYRNNWINYAYNKTKCIDPNLWFVPTVKRNTTYPTSNTNSGTKVYCANRANPSFFPPPVTVNTPVIGNPDRINLQEFVGFNQEDAIRDLFHTTPPPFMDWVHRNFTNEEVINQPIPAHVWKDLIHVRNDRKYYIGTDQRIHGYIKEGEIWKTVSPSYSAQSNYGQPVANQVKAVGSLIASPDGNTILYVGDDLRIHGFTVNSVWNYYYFDFLISEFDKQKLWAVSNLEFASNDLIFYIAREQSASSNVQHVHGFVRNNGQWSTISPTYSAQNFFFQPANTQTFAKNTVRFDPQTDRVYYQGVDNYFYYYQKWNTWWYEYHTVPNAIMVQQQITIAGDLKFGGVNNDMIYYAALESSGAIRMHAIYINGQGFWNTVSPTHSAAMWNNQPLNTQSLVSIKRMAISPSGSHIAYRDNLGLLHFYDDLGSNYAYKTFPIPYFSSAANDYHASSSLHYYANDDLFYVSHPGVPNPLFPFGLVSGDKKVHHYKYQIDYCSDPSIREIEPLFSPYQDGDFVYEDENNLPQDEDIWNYNNPGKINNNTDPFIAILPLMGNAKIRAEEIPNGINQPPANRSAEVFPIPTSNYLMIRLSDFFSGTNPQYEIYDIIGKRVMEGTLTGRKESKIDVSSLLAGTYVIAFHSGKNEILFKKNFIIIK
jgi:hypothetical protein